MAIFPIQLPEVKVIKEIDETMVIEKYDVGYMLKLSGRNSEGDYITVKRICQSLDEAFEIIRDVDTLPIC
mgnify:CR=1 FL=1